MVGQAPAREDHYSVHGKRGGRPVVLYSGPSAAAAEKSRHDAERSGVVTDLQILHGYIYPPPERNPACVCKGNPTQQFLCPFGHLTECHYPQYCGEAVCGHYLNCPPEEGGPSLGSRNPGRRGVRQHTPRDRPQPGVSASGSQHHVPRGGQEASASVSKGMRQSHDQDQGGQTSTQVGGGESGRGGGPAPSSTLSGDPGETPTSSGGPRISGPEAAWTGNDQGQGDITLDSLQGSPRAIQAQDEGTPPAPTNPELADWLVSRVRQTDTLFQDSPDEGELQCICSRCGQRIRHRHGIAIRVWPATGGELRYHPRCLGLEVL